MEAETNSKQLTINGEIIAEERLSAEDADVLDREWVKIAFTVPDAEIGDYADVVNRYYSSASAKFTDTRIGCNIGINQKPQWTRYADIRVRGRLDTRNPVSVTNVSGNYGMGSAYSENLDDPAQKIFLRFGVPKFNSLTNFLLKAFNREQTILARTGRAPTAWYNLGNYTGIALMAVAFPALTVTIAAGKFAEWIIAKPTSKFFTLKPTMYLYWTTVNHLVMNHAVNTGIIKRILASPESQRLGEPYKVSDDALQIGDGYTDQAAIMSALLPDVFRDGTIDVLAMASKAQRLANKQFNQDFQRLGSDTATDFEGYLKRDIGGNGSHATYISDNNNRPTIAAMINEWVQFGDYTKAEPGEDFIQEMDPRISADGKGEDVGWDSKARNHIDSMLKQMDAEFRDGIEYAVFRVEHTGSVQESFGNSTTESDLSQKLNGVSSQNAAARFSLADGNLIGGAIGEIIGAAKDVVVGAVDGASFGFAGLAAGLGGSGYIDIPKHWQSSTANLPRGNYTIKLISPYNNPISRLMNIWVPFYMILAGVLPRSIGKQSYTSPFYCQIFDRGRLQSRTAMIESLSITRGTSNLQFDPYGQALAIDLSFTVVDLSTIMHMPMSSGLLDGGADMTMDPDNIMADYLNVLAGMDIYSQIYPFPRAQIALTKKLAQLKYKATSPAWHAATFKNSIQEGFINDITLGASGLLASGVSAAVAGNTLLEGRSR